MNPLNWETSTQYSESSFASSKYNQNDRFDKSLNSYYNQPSQFGEWRGAAEYKRESHVRKLQNFMRVLVPVRMIGPIMGKGGQTLKGKTNDEFFKKSVYYFTEMTNVQKNFWKGGDDRKQPKQRTAKNNINIKKYSVP